MKRKGETDTLKLVSAFILILIILVVLVIIFRDQIGRSISAIINLGDEAEQGARNERCQTILSGRVCTAGGPPDTGGEWIRVAGTWEEGCAECWERVS